MRALIFVILSFYFLACGKTKKSQILDEKSNKSILVSSIDYSYSGCFGGGTFKLAVLEKNGEKVAVLTANKRFVSSVKLNDSMTDAYNQFLTELRERKFDFGCTTTAYYHVTIGTDKFEKVDGSCDWDGFENLKKSLFNK